jgi:hypothetical protein
MRTFENKAGVVYDAGKTTVIFAEDMNEIAETLPKAMYVEDDGATVTFDIDTNGANQRVVLGGNRTLDVVCTLNRPFIITLVQDATGSRTVTWFSGIAWAGGTVPTLTTTANKRDVFGFLKTGGGTYMGFVVGQNV